MTETLGAGAEDAPEISSLSPQQITVWVQQLMTSLPSSGPVPAIREFDAVTLYEAMVAVEEAQAMAERVASLMEIARKALLSGLADRAEQDKKLSRTRAEAAVLADRGYLEHVRQQARANYAATLLKGRARALYKLADMLRTEEANHRATLPRTP